MFEKALIDGDIVCYRTAAAYEHEDVELACWQASETIRRWIYETNSVGHHVFLSGSDNFRYSIYPDYKANRRDVPKPKHHGAIREHLVKEWGATVTDGIEADDAMGIELYQEENNVCVSIDKDLLMVPGWHYSPEIGGKSSKGTVWSRAANLHLVSPLEGLRHFYWQLIMGDRTDNIPGFDGKMRAKVPKFLEESISVLDNFTDEVDMYQHVRDMYEDKNQMHINAKCLWIMRKENDYWLPPHERNGLTQD